MVSGKGFLGNMTENLHADCVQSRQAGFVWCCLRKIVVFPLDNPPEMCYTKSIPKPFVSGTEIQKVRNVM